VVKKVIGNESYAAIGIDDMRAKIGMAHHVVMLYVLYIYQQPQH
jgi:hypothetical protein